MTPEREAFLITLAQIVNEYVMKDIKITVRQLYYQCVARDIIPNTLKAYKKVVRDCLEARKLGIIDWPSIVDNVRRVDVPRSWSSPGELMEAAADNYFVDRWIEQTWMPEVWVEKDAATSILQPITREFRVTFQVNRGYVSASTLWKAVRRIAIRDHENDQPTTILYFGDLDPSGEDMVRDIRDRIDELADITGDLTRFEVVKVALDADQVDFHQLPPNPAKATDSRFRGFIALTGSPLSWELDALPPDVLQQMCWDAIDMTIDAPESYEQKCNEEKVGCEAIKTAAKNLK